MRQSLDPAVQRRRLRIELRHARDKAGLTQRYVAEELGWSLSKIIRIENGQVGISRVDLGALLNMFGVVDPEKIKVLQQMADDSRRHPWSQYRGLLNPDYMKYLWYEGAASSIRHYHPLLVPGLAQTEEYAFRLISSLSPPGTPDRVIEKQVEVRGLRQQITSREDPPQLTFILDEAIIPRGFGNDPKGQAIMRGQIERLLELNSRPNVSVCILPLGAIEPHVGLRGPFVLLEFPVPDEPGLLYLENDHKSVVTTQDDKLGGQYKQTYAQMEDVCLSGGDADRFLEDALAKLAA